MREDDHLTLARDFDKTIRHVKVALVVEAGNGIIEHDGRSFEKLKPYLENKGRVSAIVTIPTLKEETFGRDLSDLLQARLTFDESINDPSLTIMTRQRLKLIRQQLYTQMENAAVL